MTSEVSKTQIDRLGDRLRKGNITEADLRLLDTYRRSFTEAYEIVVITIRKQLGLEPTGRPAKSTTSISDKLRRESIRLTQIQDIAGCRLITSDINAQNSVVQSLTELFEDTTIVDRRQQPSHGYRAVHVIVNLRGKLIEIQVRTLSQHLWAELSEKLSDVYDSAIKYGSGAEGFQKALGAFSLAVATAEALEMALTNMNASLSSQDKLTGTKKKKIAMYEESIVSSRQTLHEAFSGLIKLLEELKGGKDAVSD